MNKTFLTVTIASLSLIACKKDGDKTDSQAAIDSTATKTEEVATVIPDSAAITKAWTEYATPGDAHKRMAKDNGVWEEDMTSWQQEGAAPMKMKMTAEIKSVFDGKYQEAVHKGDFMGMPFEGKSTLAYDNASKEYISTWIDNMSTGIMVMHGNYDEASKTFKMEGEVIDPVTKKMKKMREVITMVDENTQKMEMYDTGYDGKEFKSMEITMKRKK
ncbi:hypothetical protein FCR2A7T_26080 [Flavobacterium cauense R2A-7]|uniref:Uncharacterized protein DUF1579 n=1 Tax=Flavobacterium cauense R2A-7 TaxID=1341154 RepID=V6S4A8_9FLAO|nr:DUF1579 domain-containing protein [Flavobacterium cauense]ESU19185.1 hypothetical protein FCR2A7T_26080 [Flavobacterium cauense R2A-7]KGO82191.1 hypothetical protein Q762_05740 [Flavobacterium cauense R2A-7]TWI15145.1 uncharacterized protein DUF1579 [Flavobacterium cauense R2A-7]